MTSPDLAALLRAKAPALNAVVVDAPDLSGALEYVIDLCDRKDPAVLLIDEPGTEQGPADPESSRPVRAQKVVAAVDLPAKSFTALKKRCQDKGWLLLRDGLRRYVSGIDVGVTVVEHAIADSATCLVQSTSEDALLACAICEISVMIVPRSGLLPDMRAAVPLLRKFMNRKTPCGGTYTSCITGSSRTGDIEQVLTLGAHGPVELHIVLVED